jgi:hypothetical protein
MSGSPPRSVGRPKSSNNSPNSLQKRTLLDIRAMQAPILSTVIIKLFILILIDYLK